MRIKRPRSLTGIQIGVATVLGVLGGFYIWRPILTSFTRDSENRSPERSN